MSKKLDTVQIYNCSNQTVLLQVKEPGASFFNELQVSLRSKQKVELPKDYILEAQVKNLQSRGILRILTDSSTKPD